MVGILLSLSVLNKRDHLEKVMEAVLSDSHRPPTLQAKLVDIYGHLSYQDFQSYYYAIIVSILEIFSDKFSRKNAVMYNYNMHDMMKAQLSASSRGCMRASTLRAERGIWEHILNIIGGKDSQPLWLPATFSKIGGKSLRITQGTDGSHAEGSSGPGANAELQTTKVDLQLMYQHETSENQLDQLATDLGPVDNGMCFIKRQVWPHGSLLSYEVPENSDPPCFKVLINLEPPALDDVQKKKKKSSSASRKRKREPSPPGSTLPKHAKTQKLTGSQSLGPYTTGSLPVNPPTDTYREGVVGHPSRSLSNIGMEDVFAQDIPTLPSPSLQGTPSAPSSDEASKGSTPPHSPHSDRHSGEEQSDEDEEDEFDTSEVVFQFRRRFEEKTSNSQQREKKSDAPTRQLPLSQPITSQADDASIDQESGHSQQDVEEALQVSSHQNGDKQPPPPSEASPHSGPKNMVEKSNVSPQHQAMDMTDPPLTDPKDVDQRNKGDDDDVDMDLEMSQTSQSGKGSNDPASNNSSSLTEGSTRADTPRLRSMPPELNVPNAKDKGKAKVVDPADLHRSEQTAGRGGSAKNLAGMQDTLPKKGAKRKGRGKGKGKGKEGKEKAKPKPNVPKLPKSKPLVSESKEDELAESSDVGRDDKEEEDFVLSASALCKLKAVRELNAKIPTKAYAEPALDPKNMTDWKLDLALLSMPNKPVHEELTSIWKDTGNPNQPFVRNSFTTHWPETSVRMPGLKCFRDLLEASGHNRDERPYKSHNCISVLDTTVASWSNEKLLKMHKDCDIHVIPSQPPAPQGFNHQTCEKIGMNVYQTCQVHENRFRDMDNYHSEMQKGSLHQLLDSNPDNPGRQNVNFLSIPLPQNAMPPDCIQCISLIARASQQYCATPFPADSLSWGLVATVPAMSPVHRDAGKFAMWIQVVSGTKLWSLLEDGASNPRPSDALVDIGPKDFQWTGLVLRPGHILTHCTDTWQHNASWKGKYCIHAQGFDCVVKGGHFYSKVTLGHSLKAGLQEHWWGRLTTNTEHLASESIFYQLLKHYKHCLLLLEYDKTVDPDLPEDEELAALLAMVMCLEEFELQVLLNNDHGREMPWVWPDGLKEDRLQGKGMALYMLNEMPHLYPLCQQFWMSIEGYKVRCSNQSQDPQSNGGEKDVSNTI
ncbi:hypothetical protein K439DRAFT_1624097 [Ramaria rubella]|nr:hypothetical protein K439DRAFT_1624097 [Ramaria rubella]